MNRWKLPLACLALLTLAVAAPAAAETVAQDAPSAEPAVAPEATPAPGTSLLPVAPIEQFLWVVGDSCSQEEAFVLLTGPPCEEQCTEACADAGGRLWCYDNARACFCTCCPL